MAPFDMRVQHGPVNGSCRARSMMISSLESFRSGLITDQELGEKLEQVPEERGLNQVQEALLLMLDNPFGSCMYWQSASDEMKDLLVRTELFLRLQCVNIELPVNKMCYLLKPIGLLGLLSMIGGALSSLTYLWWAGLATVAGVIWIGGRCGRRAVQRRTSGFGYWPFGGREEYDGALASASEKVLAQCGMLVACGPEE